MVKNLIIIGSIVAVTGCSFILPRSHDPVMFGDLVDVKISVSKLNCTDKNWTDTFSKVERLKVYAELRSDPQADAVTQLEESLEKANKSNNKVFCENLLKVNKTRIDVIAEAWSGR